MKGNMGERMEYPHFEVKRPQLLVSPDLNVESRAELVARVAACIDAYSAMAAYPGEERFFFIERIIITPEMFRAAFDSLLGQGITVEQIKNALPPENQLPPAEYEF